MGFLEGIKQALSGIFPRAEPEGEKELELSALGQFLESRTAKKVRVDNSAAISISGKIIDGFGEINKLAEALDKKEPYAKGTFPAQVLSSGKSSKDFFCKQAVAIANKLHSPEGLAALRDFEKEVALALKQLDLDPKKAELFELCYADEAKLARSVLTDISRLRSELSVLINPDSLLHKSGLAEELLKKAVSLEAELSQISAELGTEERRLKELREQQAEIAKKLEALDAASSTAEIDTEIEESERKKKDMTTRLSVEFSGLKKILKKYQHDSKGSAPEDIGAFIEDFPQALLEDKQLKILAIMAGLKAAVANGKIMLDERSRETALACFGLLHKDYAENVQSEHAKLVGRVDELERRKNEQLIPIKLDTDEAKKQLRKTEAEIAERDKSVKAKSRTRDSWSSELNNLKQELEKVTSELTGVNITISA